MTTIAAQPPSHRLERRAAQVAVATGVVLMGVKFAAYLLTGSAAIFSDAMESIVNIVASGVSLYSLRVAHAPPDADHPYGHGRVEFLSAALEGGMICAAAGAIVIKGLHDFASPGLHLRNIWVAVGIMTLSMLANGAVGLALIRAGRRSGSVTLVADGRHLMSDAITSVGAVLAILVVTFTGWRQADPLMALLVAAYLVFAGGRMLKAALDMLMDKQDPHDQVMLAATLDAHVGPGPGPRICGYHKLRHRHVGRYHWIDFHITVPAHTPVHQAHDVASAIEGEIERSLGHADATAHIEPCDAPSCPTCAGSQAHQRDAAAPGHSPSGTVFP